MKKEINIEENLLLDYLLGRSGEGERRQVESWLQESEANRKQLDRLERLWLESGKISPAPVAIDTDAAWEKFSARADLQEKKRSNGKILRFGGNRAYRYALATAASILLLAGLFSIFYFLVSSVKQIEITSDQTMVCDTLSDGTIVTMNRGSKLFYPETFDKKARMVRMEGEIFFRVKHDCRHSFIVEAGSGRIRVLGTSFNVLNLPGEGITVSVREGRVALFDADTVVKDTSTIILDAGMTGSIKSGKHLPEIIPSAPDDLFWYDRSLVFRDTELKQVLAQLNSHYGVTVDIGDPSIGLCRLSASFRDDKAETILKVISETFGLKLIIIGKDHYSLTGKGCATSNQ